MEPNSGDQSPPSNHRRRSGTAKRKAATAALSALSTLSASLNPPTKRQSKNPNPNNSHHSLFQSGPLTRARGSGGIDAFEYENMAEFNDMTGVGLDPLMTEEMEDPLTVAKEEEESIVDLQFEAIKTRSKDVHVVPTFSGWFSWKSIHDIEKQTLVSFFNGKSEKRTPESYMQIRNTIMKKFHSNPQSQISLENLSELSDSDSDSDAWKEVLEFLDHWGLINFHPFIQDEDDVSKTGEDDVSKTREDDVRKTEDKIDPALLDKLYQFETNQSYVAPVRKKVVPAVQPALVQGVLHEPGLGEDLVPPTEPSIEYHCNSCSADCSRKRYHCRTQADFDLCTDCYTESKFGSGMTSADFILMESAEAPGVGGATWTDEETLLLLEALELFGANWNEIADHVGTKSKAQCMLHFLQMPIQDPFFIHQQKDKTEKDNEEEKDEKEEEKDKKEEKDEKEEVDLGIRVLKEAFEMVGFFPETGLDSVSFADAGNPVMALAAFLTGLVEQDKGSRTTYHRSSLKAMSESSPSLQLATRHCFILEGPPHDDVSIPQISSSSDVLGVKAAGTEIIEKMEDLNEKSKEDEEEESKKENKLPDDSNKNNEKDSEENNEKEEEITTENNNNNNKSGDLLETVNSEEESGPSEKKDEKNNNEDCKIIRLKRAASTALSSAAVKAKYLAKQEEDQIRQLVALIIDKQFRKMEAKLEMFFDLEGMIVKIKEQTDKVRQRLMHERSQIIAARLGLQNPPPFRNPNPNPYPNPNPIRNPNPNPNQQTLAANRLAAAYATAMAGQRPPNMLSSMPIRRP